MGRSAYRTSATMAVVAPMPPMNGSGMRKPNRARLGTVWNTFATPSTGPRHAGRRVSRTPSGTPITIAAPVEIATRYRCCPRVPGLPASCGRRSPRGSCGCHEGFAFRMIAPPELVGRAEKREPALQHEPDAGAEQQPLTHVVRHKDHALAEPPLERRELALQLHPGNRVERAEGLVQEQERRVGG